MNKNITVVLKTQFSLPFDAQVVSYLHNEECVLEHVKLSGKLLRPEIQWLELLAEPPQGLQAPHSPIWLSVEEQTASYFHPHSEEWYLEEES